MKECIGGVNEYVYIGLCDIVIDVYHTHGSLEDDLQEALKIAAKVKKQKQKQS